MRRIAATRMDFRNVNAVYTAGATPVFHAVVAGMTKQPACMLLLTANETELAMQMRLIRPAAKRAVVFLGDFTDGYPKEILEEAIVQATRDDKVLAPSCPADLPILAPPRFFSFAQDHSDRQMASRLRDSIRLSQILSQGNVPALLGAARWQC